uniref:G_PROTEIN_RECEP_F1_2 domain-containing protein n=1 Tax=Loa loa TaxID=7209 RepID=A0A1I7VKT1_LOALO
MWQSYALWALYLVTMKIGIIGNLWVICSVIRNTRPQTHGWLRRPSDCLRSYIFVLALVDFFVVCSLALRIVYVWDETLTFAVTLLPCFLVLIPILLTMKTIDVTPDRWDCHISDDSAWNRLTGLLVGACFILLLMLVSANYAEIVRHVHRKFSRRKARRKSFQIEIGKLQWQTLSIVGASIRT